MSLHNLIDTDLLQTFGEGTIVPLKGAVGTLAADIAVVETSPTTAAHAQGDLLIYGGVLYKAKTAIAVGAALTVGTNIEATTVATEVKNSGSAITVDSELSTTSENPVQNKVITNTLIGVLGVSVPTQNGTLTYNGSSQSPVWSGYDSTKMTIGGTTSATNAGDYTATFTPIAPYMWSDGTRVTKNVVWSIGKATGTLTLSKTSVSTLKNLSTTVTITTNSDGTKSATSSNSSRCTASVSGTTVTITGGSSSGSATVTVSIAQSTNYTAVSKTISVSNTAASSTLADNSPATIKAVAQSGQAANLWSVGDKIGISLSGTVGSLSISGTYYAFILGFNHNSSREGSNSIHFMFGKTSDGTNIVFCDSGYSNFYGSDAMFRMNSSKTNGGGWSSSYMRSTICPSFKLAMPSAWQSVIAACTKYSDNTGGGSDTASNVTATTDTLFLLSEFEVQGARTTANSKEKDYQAQYAYFANGNSKVFYKHDATSTACIWWLRSARVTNSTSFCGVGADGSTSGGDAYYSLGFAPAFKVA